MLSKGIGASLPIIFDNAFVDHDEDGSHHLTFPLDMGGHGISDVSGIGCANGKSITFAQTADEIKAYCEDPGVGVVYICAGTYIILKTIVPTSNTHIIGLGHVRLDWGGAVNGYMMLNTAATDCILDNLHFVRDSAVNYRGPKLGNRALFRGIRSDYLGWWWYVTASDQTFIKCTIDYLYLDTGVGMDFIGCEFTRTLVIYRARKIRFLNCNYHGVSVLDIYVYSNADMDILCAYCDFKTTASYCVWFNQFNNVTVKNIKFDHCDFEPLNNTKLCIEAENAAMTLEDIDFSHCTFRDAKNAFSIPAAVTMTKWRFSNGMYKSIADASPYNFTVPGSSIFTMDGPKT